MKLYLGKEAYGTYICIDTHIHILLHSYAPIKFAEHTVTAADNVTIEH